MQQGPLQNQAGGGIPVARTRQRSVIKTSNWIHSISLDLGCRKRLIRLMWVNWFKFYSPL